jgi:hypothetical protein
MDLLPRLVRKARNRLFGSAPIHVASDGARQAGSAVRVTARIDGQDLWFESDTAPLNANNETWVSALYFTAMKSNRPLVIRGELDSAFTANLAAIRRLALSWWGFQGGRIMMAPGIATAPERPAASGIFFTGGVDSFYSLARRIDEVRYLINVEGFDIQLSDAARLGKNRALIDGIADELGLEVIRVRTNLREHAAFTRLNWEITHVAALAAVGHLLTPVLSTIYVASSDVPPPWGSHPDLDVLWSSSLLSIENDGASAARLDKVEAIRDWPLVHRALKVCWENRSEDLNCGCCEKCVRTQAQFFAAGLIDPLPAFPSGDLVQRVEALPLAKHDLWKQWSDIAVKTHSDALRQAIQALLNRSAQSSHHAAAQ